MAKQTEVGSAGLSGAVVLITGALTGIGRATALAFAKEGSRIVVSGRREKEGFSLAAELQGIEVANAIVFVGSNSAPFLTGQSVVVDGGRSL